jgi:hypothetical protein
VVPISTMLVWVHFQQIIIKKQVKEQIIAGIDRKQQVLLEFSTVASLQKLQWKNSREFSYKGQLYDIVEQGVKGNVTYYWCWKDNKESEVEKHFQDLLSKTLSKDPQKKDNQNRLNNFLKSLFYAELLHYPAFYYQVVKFGRPQNFPCPASCPAPLTPPPEIA